MKQQDIYIAVLKKRDHCKIISFSDFAIYSQNFLLNILLNIFVLFHKLTVRTAGTYGSSHGESGCVANWETNPSRNPIGRQWEAREQGAVRMSQAERINSETNGIKVRVNVSQCRKQKLGMVRYPHTECFTLSARKERS